MSGTPQFAASPAGAGFQQPQHPHEFESTLEEPVWETIARDLRAIGRKMMVVVLPCLGGDKELRDWDLWGPLLLCLLLALTLGSSAQEDQSGLVFAAVFVVVWLGSGVVTLNASFLGAKVSFFQTVCVMGYSLAPMAFGAIINLFASAFFVIKFMISVVAFFWASWASLRFFRGTIKPERESLVVYPLALFYLFLAWMMTAGL
jgi:hypothetical protein